MGYGKPTSGDNQEKSWDPSIGLIGGGGGYLYRTSSLRNHRKYDVSILPVPESGSSPSWSRQSGGWTENLLGHLETRQQD